ncbi:MAG TPA: tetratricopeptide repeat protein [Ktedonobacterales bacterium]|nr:tetratricopeptide repeat protein [Ktedonobacterales bacterium]
MRPLQIVLSFCQADQAVADTLIDALTKAGADVWHDTSHEILPPRMQYHMITRPVFIVLLSPAALVSPEIEAACEYALKRERQRSAYIILPILLASFDTNRCTPTIQTILQYVASPASTTAMINASGERDGLSNTDASPSNVGETNGNAAKIGAAAIAMLLRQLALTPEVVAVEEMSLASRIMYGKSMTHQDRHESAQAVIEPITQTHPDLLIGWLLLGIIFNDSKQYAAALPSFERARSLAPQNAAPLRYQGFALANLNRDQEALAAYNIALSLSPNDQFSLDSRGRILARLGNTNGAVTSYLTALEYEPFNSRVRSSLAEALCQIHEYDKALEQVEQILTLNPDDSTMLAMKAAILVEMEIKHPAEAMRFIEKAIALAPQTEALWIIKIMMLRRMKYFGEGLAFCDARLVDDPQSTTLWQYKAIFQCEMRSFSEALPSATQFVRLAPENAYSWNLFGWVLLKLGKYEAALEAFERALAINPTLDGALRNKAFVLKQLR